mgnify:CR=1 FL=1
MEPSGLALNWYGESLQKDGDLLRGLFGEKSLKENFGSNIKLNYVKDQSLIGGLVLQVGSVMIDTSIKNKLKQIEQQMIEA